MLNKIVKETKGLTKKWSHSKKVKKVADSLSPVDVSHLIDLLIKQDRLVVSDDDNYGCDIQIIVGHGMTVVVTTPEEREDQR